MLLKERTAIVTGGSSGIGRGIAIEFAREGANVVVADIQDQPKRGIHHETDVHTLTVEEIEGAGAKGLFIQTDVADESQIESLIDQTVDHFGGLDILVNNAGVAVLGTSDKVSIAAWDHATAVNMRSAFIATKFAAPHLKQSAHGRVLHISSIYAGRGGCGQPYAASKAGLINMARDTAVEVARHRVTAKVICPGYIETAMQDYSSAEQVEQVRQRIPLPRFGIPRDIGRAAVFLASDDAEWITGTALVVDGGHSSLL